MGESSRAVFNICSATEAQISMRIGGLRRVLQSASLSITSQDAKNAKHVERVARICGAATIPLDVMSADEGKKTLSKEEHQ